uniref:Uncharacterized protein n=1 Tax=Rhizophora mucronata TaxID=61149 RepID=A0A2P2MJD3_RHIMU
MMLSLLVIAHLFPALQTPPSRHGIACLMEFVPGLFVNTLIMLLVLLPQEKIAMLLPLVALVGRFSYGMLKLLLLQSQSQMMQWKKIVQTVSMVPAIHWL